MVTPILPLIMNLRSDPFESAMDESGAWENWAFELLWIFTPMGGEVKNFLSTIPDYPFQMGNTLSAGGINYSLIEKAKAMKNMQDLINKIDSNQTPDSPLYTFFPNLKHLELTNDEREIVIAIREGKSNKEIAYDRNTTLSIIKHKIFQLYKKCGINSRWELISLL